MRKGIATIALTLAALHASAFADVSNDLHNFFNGLNFAGNATSAHAYQGQMAGYYSGGSLFERDSVRNLQIVHVDLPSFSSGCGGIDMFTGGFSFANKQAFEQMLKNLLSNSAGVAFQLAMESATPEIANVLKYIQGVVQKINNQNFNSCHMAEDLVGGLWPKTRASQQMVCEAAGSQSGNIFSDWASARQGCGNGGDFNQGINAANGNAGYKSMVVANTNIVWKSLMSDSFTASDTQLAEFFMSLSGTIIVGDPKQNEFKVLSSLATNNSLLKALMHGGTAKIYTCSDTSKCLAPTPGNVTIDQSDALVPQVSTLLEDMVSKIQTNTPLTTTEIGLLNSTSIPIYKILNVQTAYAQDKSIIDVSQYANLIAANILYQYLQGALNVVAMEVAAQQIPQSMAKRVQDDVSMAMTQVNNLQTTAYQRVAETFQLIQETRLMERSLAGMLSHDLQGNLAFAKGEEI